MRVLGVDPGSHRTGWGVVSVRGSRLSHIASGTIQAGGGELASRLRVIAEGLEAVLSDHRPDVVSVERIFHAKNADSALKLGHARGVVLLCIARADAPLFEYSAAEIKQATVGHGGADKMQVQRMVSMVLGYQGDLGLDQSDALAAAICHAHMGPSRQRLAELDRRAGRPR